MNVVIVDSILINTLSFAKINISLVIKDEIPTS